MKTKSTFVLAVFATITAGGLQKANAQAWTLSGNNNANNGSRLGTLNNFPLRIVANGNDWMRLETDGRVNINAGGLAPSLTKARFAINSSPQQDPFRVMINGNTRFLVNEKGGVSIGTTTEGPARGLLVNGNVGIGVAEPAVKLHIAGGSDAGFNGGFIVTGDLASDNMGIDNNEIQTRTGGIASTLYLNNDGGDINLRADAMHITSGKLVGIGTASPLAKLHVVGTSFFNGNVGIGTASPLAKLHIIGGSDSEPGSGGYIVTGSVTETNISIDDNEIMARNNGDVGKLYLNYDGGEVVIGGTNSGTKVGIGVASPAYQLQLSTNSAAKPGSALWTVATPSLRLQKNVTDFTDGLNIIKQIHPVWYNYNGEAGITSDERGVGTLGEELQKVAPYMVKEQTYQKEESGVKTNYLSTDYNALLFIFVNAIKEQQEEINRQDKKIEELVKMVQQLKGPSSISSADNSNLKSVSTDAFLEQNAPNPFHSNTIIRYRLPASAGNARIIVTNTAGIVIKTFALTSKDAGSVTINGGELAAGTYNYSLVVDGKKVDSKKMVFVK